MLMLIKYFRKRREDEINKIITSKIILIKEHIEFREGFIKGDINEMRRTFQKVINEFSSELNELKSKIDCIKDN